MEFEDITRQQTEFKIHRAIIDHLEGQTRKGNETFGCHPPFLNLLFTTIYQGRNAEDGFFLKMLGVKPGIADIIAWYKTHKGLGCSFIEVKTKTGSQSSPQKKIQARCSMLGIAYVIVRSVQQVHDHLKSVGLKPQHNNVREPDLRSDAQKKQDAYNFYKKQ